MSRIMREVVVLGVNPETEMPDFSGYVKGDPVKGNVKNLPQLRVVPVTFLKDVDSYSKETGYVGEVSIKRHNFPVADMALIKQCVPGAKLLITVEQTIIERGDKKGDVIEKVIGVRPGLVG